MRTETPTPVENRTEAVPTVYVVIGIVVLIVLGIALAAGILFLASNYSAELEAVRDVFIIALALESCVFGVVLLLMLIMLIRLVNTVEFEIKPILEQTNETIGTVRGTTNFVSKNVIDPVVKTKSYVVGIRQGLRSLFGDPRKNLPD
jgi:tellurite resistance protein TehA-like permease